MRVCLSRFVLQSRRRCLRSTPVSYHAGELLSLETLALLFRQACSHASMKPILKRGCGKYRTNVADRGEWREERPWSNGKRTSMVHRGESLLFGDSLVFVCSAIVWVCHMRRKQRYKSGLYRTWKLGRELASCYKGMSPTPEGASDDYELLQSCCEQNRD